MRWAKAIEDIEIYAFEPSKDTASVLTRNISRNFLENKIEVVNEAISNELGFSELVECEDDAYSSLKDTLRKKIVKTSTVTLNTID